MSTYGQKFLQKILEAEKEETNKKENSSSTDLSKLLGSIPSKQGKAIVTVLVALGAPVNALFSYRNKLRELIEPSESIYLNSNSFRLWVKKLLAELSFDNHIEEDSFDRRLTGKYQHLIFHILKALGMPEQIEKNYAKDLSRGIKKIAGRAVEDSNIRIYLGAIASELNISDKVRNISEDVLTEDVDAAKDSLVVFLQTLGFDLASNRSLEFQMKQQKVLSRLRTLGANTTLISRVNSINSLLQSKTRQMFEGEVLNDIGWSFGKLGSERIMLKGGDLTFKISNDNELDILKTGLQSANAFSIKSDRGENVIFNPSDSGFNVTKKNSSYEVHMNEDEIKKLLSLID